MNWIFDHFQIVLALAGALAYWLKQRSDGGAGEDDAEKQIAEREARERRIAEQIYGQDAEAVERTRKVQEEIRRRRAQREGGLAPAPQAPSMPSERPVPSPVHAPRPVSRPVARPFQVQPPARVEPPPLAQTAAMDARRQEEIADQLRALEAAKLSAQRRAKELTITTAENVATAAKAGVVSADLVSELRDARNLRRAVVLREVLGAPVALR